MSDGITDMHREEERKAAELVEKKCYNCRYCGSFLCKDCVGRDFFVSSQSAIDAKVEELRVKGAVGIQAVIENGTRFTCGSIGCLLDTSSVGTKSDCRCLTELNFGDKIKVGRYIQREKALKKEMLEVLKSSKEVITDNCRSECDFYNTSDCDLGCATKSMMNSMDRILKKVEGN